MDSGFIIFSGVFYTVFWLAFAPVIYFLLGKKVKLFCVVMVVIYFLPLWKSIPTHYYVNKLCNQTNRFVIYKKYHFKDAVLKYFGNRMTNAEEEEMMRGHPTSELLTDYSVVFDPLLRRSDVNFRLGKSYYEERFFIKIKYTLYNDKKEIVAYYINYSYRPGVGDDEFFYNPFLFVRLISYCECDGYLEEQEKYQQMIHDAIVTQPNI